MTGTGVHIGNKRVKFNPEVNRIEYTPDSSDADEEEPEDKEKDSNNSSVSEEDDGDSEEIGSDPEDFVSGKFFNRIRRETKQAESERKYLINELKVKSRVGSIFFDKVMRVVAAIQRENGKFDYLIEWEYSKADKLKPTTSIVKGS